MGSPRGVGTVGLTILCLFFAGCMDNNGTLNPDDATTNGNFQLAPVIALIDTGTNPYHPQFLAPAPDYVTRQLAGYQEITLSTEGDAAAKLEADQETLKSLESNQLYYFHGTRLLTIGMDETPDSFATFDPGHGQGTTYLAARDAPHAIIVLIQVDLGVCQERPGCVLDSSVAEAMEWASQQPWIDVISVSLGIPGNPPLSEPVQPDMQRYLAASRQAAADGKLVINAAGNAPVAPITGYQPGPPWVITVGGTEAESRGENVVAGKTSDVHANFSEQVPIDYDGTLRWSAGTSLGAPIVAATLAEAIHHLRTTGHTTTSTDLRTALNLSAILFAPTDWDPTPQQRETELGTLYATTLPALTPAQSAWGYIDSTLAGEIARRIRENDLATPPEKATTEAFQSQWQQAREDYWATYPS